VVKIRIARWIQIEKVGNLMKRMILRTQMSDPSKELRWRNPKARKRHWMR
jgi:hypothetical protein